MHAYIYVVVRDWKHTLFASSSAVELCRHVSRTEKVMEAINEKRDMCFHGAASMKKVVNSSRPSDVYVRQ